MQKTKNRSNTEAGCEYGNLYPVMYKEEDKDVFSPAGLTRRKMDGLPAPGKHSQCRIIATGATRTTVHYYHLLWYKAS